MGLGQAEAQVAAGDVGEGEEVALDAVGQADEVVGAFAQQSALLGELHVERASGEELVAQFPLQRLHLLGQRRL